MAEPPNPQLNELAKLYGIETAYYDVAGNYCVASTDALLATLRALGAPVARLEDVSAAIRDYHESHWRRPIDPVVVAWEGGELAMEVRLPAAAMDAALTGRLILENGEELSWGWRAADLPVLRVVDIEGAGYVAKRLALSVGLPPGYHHLALEFRGTSADCTVISAPQKCWTRAEDAVGRAWGVFLPLYALKHEGDWGSGNYSGLERLMDWVGERGGRVMGTLPLNPSFLDEPFDPSPYSPITRLLWNEFYVDITIVPELAVCPAAQTIVESPEFKSEVAALRQLPCVDYRRGMALKRRVMEELARSCFEESGRRDALRGFIQANPLVDDYARFRAVGERRRQTWPEWPSPLRGGTVTASDYDEDARRYHLYAQWLAHEQIEGLSRRSRENGVELYLDLPLGVNTSGYDVWRNQDIFVLDASGGAPPDPFFMKGQNWGFPPLHPRKIRDAGYRYVADCFRHLMRHAGTLRIDHIMGFHRLFWIPKGMEAKQGLYVHYHPEEFYAVLALESRRSRTMVVGEDLGTVPPEVSPAMARHGLEKMYVLQFQINPDPANALNPVTEDMAASFGTHDLPPFALFWQGLDIADRKDLGLLDEEGVRQESERRRALKNAFAEYVRKMGWAQDESGMLEMLRAALVFLGDSQGGTVLVTLEDLWLEPKQQNTPGTWLERPNWCRRARYSLDEFSRLPQVIDILRELDARRKSPVSR